MTARRIIPCLDVKDGRVVKGVRFQGHRDVGDAVELAQRYRDQGADELVFYDISASPERRTLDYGWVRAVARRLDIPFCVAGGIRSVDQASRCLDNGADKISVNSPALERPDLIRELAARLGSQCVTVGIDSLCEAEGWTVRQYAGDPGSIRSVGRLTLDWAREAEALGAGEIVLNCIDRDGVRGGYDLDQLAAVRARLTIPLVASGGAGSAADFIAAFQIADVSGALAADVFHDGTVILPELKRRLAEAGVEIRI